MKLVREHRQGKFFLLLALCACTLIMSTDVSANPRILQALKTLSLDDSGQSSTDYYISGGLSEGYHEGTVLDVYRRSAVSDALEFDKSFDVEFWVGQLRIMSVQQHVSVARVIGVAHPGSNPQLQNPLPLVGDRVEIGRARATSQTWQRIPGVLILNQRGNSLRLSENGERYLNKVAQFIRRESQEIKSVTLVSAKDAAATRVYKELHRRIASQEYAPKITWKKGRALPKNGVAIILERQAGY